MNTFTFRFWTTLLAALLPATVAQGQTSLPSPCQTSINNATVVLEASASSSAVSSSALQTGDPLVAVTPDSDTCTGETTLDTGDNQSFALAEADPQADTPGYEDGDRIYFWAQASNGEVFFLSPTFAPCDPGDTLCVDEPIYQRNGIYTLRDVSVTAIPVELVRWGARVDGPRVVLEWETASETANAGFQVLQRAADGAAWRTLGFVEGHGTTQTPQRYRFTTEPLTPGEYAFRLRQVDIDGTATLTRTETVSVTSAAAWLSPPQPHPVRTSSALTLHVTAAQPVAVHLYDVLGRRVATLYQGRAAPGSPVTLPLSGAALSAGTYVVVANGASFRQTRRITVMR
jgi:hypothetical protein